MATVAAPFMNWQDSWSVGVRAIDSQHQKLVSLINELFDAMKSGRGGAVMADILGSLVSYTKAHFSTEEQLLQLHGYPDLAAHKVQHKKFTDQVSDFQRQFSEGTLTLSIDVMNFLKDWLKNHILGTDKKYTSFLHGRGVQ